MNLTYDERIAQQIATYAETINMHDLPDVFHVWSDSYLRPALEEVFGTSSIDEAYAFGYLDAKVKGRGRILSIGSGDGEVEIRVAKALLKHGITDFTIVCSDVSPILIERNKAAVQRDGLEQYFEPVVSDLNKIDIPGRFDMIMANHSLHHIQELEYLFDYSFERLTENGVFITNDMIGRNGHMRWPEAKVFVDLIWPLLSDTQKIHTQLRRFNEKFIDHDCSLGGDDFEGIRAQDILPLILQRFMPHKFICSGGIIDLFVDRGFGHGFDRGNESDMALIHLIAGINDVLLDAGVITPTWTMASFTKNDRGQKYYRTRTAELAVRKADPSWLRYHKF
ncbi:class I SAM-dependent methyltransferase [Affinirhizobium pseudoryzae]|uniref:class I SAM-dependent methyltransferase n=1 Tax=Allorhizobium pseudoryzae TaxID=379684 RepID=UPI0013EAE0A5|nr:class I SAM-dependent methyltransferase [Allorhizobium pseudoryzae]